MNAHFQIAGQFGIVLDSGEFFRGKRLADADFKLVSRLVDDLPGQHGRPEAGMDQSRHLEERAVSAAEKDGKHGRSAMPHQAGHGLVPFGFTNLPPGQVQMSHLASGKDSQCAAIFQPSQALPHWCGVFCGGFRTAIGIDQDHVFLKFRDAGEHGVCHDFDIGSHGGQETQ